MRELRSLALVLVALLGATGCAAFRDREWGTCAVAGAVVGGAVGGITGGVVTNNNSGTMNDTDRGAAIGGGIAGGAALGALLGHVICDPEKQAPEPPLVQAPPPAPVPKGTVLATVAAAHFDFDKSNIKPAGRVALDKAVTTLKEHPEVNVVVKGYTDAIGTDAYNLRLSERRADAVKNYLVEQGISSSRITTRGYGKADPVASNATEEGRARNRRAEVVAD
jgi:outer membrane protein OmpA-like peptidoglycan-associated protein